MTREELLAEENKPKTREELLAEEGILSQVMNSAPVRAAAPVFSVFGSVLNVLNRPVSAVMGVMDAADEYLMYSQNSPTALGAQLLRYKEKDVTLTGQAMKAFGNVKDALVDGRSFGFTDMIERRDIPGFDVPETARWGGALAADITNPIDPMSKLKLFSKGADGVRSVASLGNTSLLPKAVNKAVTGTAARAWQITGAQALTDAVSNAYVTQRKIEKKYDDFFSFAKDRAYDLDNGLVEKQDYIAAIRNAAKDAGLGEKEQEFIFSVLENPNAANPDHLFRKITEQKGLNEIYESAKQAVSNRVAQLDEVITQLKIGSVAEPPKFEAYHGSSSPVDIGFSYDRRQAQNLYGPGFYTTLDPSVASEYMKKGGGKQPSLYGVKWTSDKQQIWVDLDDRLPQDVLSAMQNAVGELVKIDPSKPGTKIYESIREALSGESMDAAEDVLDAVNRNIADLGYTGLGHTGGRIRGAKSHPVRIFFDPIDPVSGASNISLSQIKKPIGRQLLNSFDQSAIDSISKSVDKQREIQSSLERRLADMMERKQAGAANLDGEIKALWDALDDVSINPIKTGDEPIDYTQQAAMLLALKERDDLMRAATKENGFKDAALGLIKRAGVNNYFNVDDVKAVDVFGREVMVDPQVKEFISLIKPFQEYAVKTFANAYEVAGLKPAKLPYGDNYMRHVSEGGGIALFPASFSPAQRRDEVVADLTRRFLADGESAAVAATRAKKMADDMMAYNPSKGSRLSKMEQAGHWESLLGRKVDLDAIEIKLSDAYKINMNVFNTVNKMVQTADRFNFTVSLNKAAKDMYGKTADQLKQMHPSEAAQFVEMPFRFRKFVDAEPFEGVFIPKDLARGMENVLGYHSGLTSGEGMNLFFRALDTVSKVWKATMLIVFPSKWTRDFIGSTTLMAAGDTSLLTPDGQKAFFAAMNMFGKGFNSGLQKVNQAAARATGATADTERSLKMVMDELTQLYPDAGISTEKIRKALFREDLIGTHHFRDLGMVETSNAVKGLPAKEQDSMWRKVAKDFAADINPFNAGDESRSALVRGLNPLNYFMPSRFESNPHYQFYLKNIGQPVEDVPRAAMYMDHLLKNARNGLKFEEASSRAAEHARRFLGDPTGKGMTEFERKYAPIFVPLYRWDRHNLPLQLQLLTQEPGKLTPLARLYNNSWQQYDERYSPENTPDYIDKGLGIPVGMSKDRDGNPTVSFALLQGWLPAADLSDWAEMLGDNGGGGELVATLMNKSVPYVRPYIEAAVNYNFFLKKKIDEGQAEEVFGIAMDPTLAHTLRQVRFISEIDRLNPGDIWTHMGRFFGNFEKERPSRAQVDQTWRVIKTLTGLGAMQINEPSAVKSDYFDLKDDIIEYRGSGREALRSSDTASQSSVRNNLLDAQRELRDIQRRLNEANGRNAALKAGRQNQ